MFRFLCLLRFNIFRVFSVYIDHFIPVLLAFVVVVLVFTVQRQASAVYTVVVCLSDPPSVCHKPALYQNG